MNSYYLRIIEISDLYKITMDYGGVKCFFKEEVFLTAAKSEFIRINYFAKYWSDVFPVVDE